MLETQTKGTGANMVPLERTRKRAEAVPGFNIRKPAPREPEAATITSSGPPSAKQGVGIRDVARQCAANRRKITLFEARPVVHFSYAISNGLLQQVVGDAGSAVQGRAGGSTALTDGIRRSRSSAAGPERDT